MKGFVLSVFLGLIAFSLAVTVEQAVNNGCSTTLVLGLSKQLIEEMNCMKPGLFSNFQGASGISLGSAAFPYLQTPAVNALKAAVAQKGGTLSINSALRTLAQQYLLYRWGQLGKCGISAVAAPGRSNHNGGLAIDTSDYSAWKSTLAANNWQWFGSGDVVHFTYVGAGTVDVRTTSVLAFQRLWNRNNPNDQIAEDGNYGPTTESRLKVSPSEGFPKGANCGTPSVVSCTTGSGANGVCMDTASCTGTPVAGFCPGASNIQCCTNTPPAPSPSTCIVNGVTGSCIDTTQCTGVGQNSFPGYCSGPNNIQCCATAQQPSTSTQTTNQAGIDLIKSFEGFYPNFYIDPVGIKTIGYGHACHVNDCSNLQGKTTTGTWYQVTPPLSLQEADDLLRGDLQSGGYESCVRAAVTRTITDNQFAALVSFTFNAGCGALKSSTLLSRVNSGTASASSIRDAFLMWTKGGGQVLPGLVRRRNAEADLYLSSTSPTPVSTTDGVGTKCYQLGREGICLYSTDCTGTTVSGLCPGPSTVKCCFGNTCNSGNGLCIPTSLCSATPQSGLCPGSVDIKCCPKTAAAAETPIVMPCPEGSVWNSNYLLCETSSVAYGPFSAAEIAACRAAGGGSACDARVSVFLDGSTVFLEKWSLALARQIRPLTACPLGSVVSQVFGGYCFENVSESQQHVWGSYPINLILACQDAGGGSSCSTVRWDAGFFLAVFGTNNNLVVVSDEANVNITNYNSETNNPYLVNQQTVSQDLATSTPTSDSAVLVPLFFLFVSSVLLLVL